MAALWLRDQVGQIKSKSSSGTCGARPEAQQSLAVTARHDAAIAIVKSAPESVQAEAAQDAVGTSSSTDEDPAIGHHCAHTQRAVVEWGAIPYYKTTGRPAEFVYYTTERASDLRPELLAAWHAARARGLEIGGQTALAGSSSSSSPSSSSSSSSSTSSSAGQMPDWISERLRDCWVVEQLVYWVEFLQEWKYYRDYYVFREELFDGEVPEILCQGCKDCSGRLAALVPLPDCDLESVPAETEVPPLNRSTSQPESGKTIVTKSCCELKREACD
ncbi:hypothetical protein HYQ44_003599 [Verticillium longisporum]|nr:hypothetical protein HYQ44_003599 [Verticillium longisporum]